VQASADLNVHPSQLRERMKKFSGDPQRLSWQWPDESPST
jgi:hypothetical protein